jgi:PBP1b-binding outer membrane lipoprotein LpoB
VKTEGMKKVRAVAALLVCLLLSGCAARKQPAAATPPPVRSQLPPASAETIEHCVVTGQENSNTVTCSCDPATTRIDSKTKHVTLVCKTKEEK